MTKQTVLKLHGGLMGFNLLAMLNNIIFLHVWYLIPLPILAIFGSVLMINMALRTME